ncbi:MAG: elongation factor G [Planctomycetota bacterium]
MADIKSIRNVVLCGHGSVGKTTLADAFLTTTGAVSGNPSVDDGSSICDFDPEEKSHKYSIEAASINFEHGGNSFNVIDTPGYPDFIGQVIGPIQAADTACIVINCGSGIEVNTRRVWKEAEAAGIGKMIILNKIDEENVDFAGVVNSIREMWGNQCILLNVPAGKGPDFKGVISTLELPESTDDAIVDPKLIHEPLIESIIEVDDGVMERYFEGQPPTRDELSRLITQAVASGTLVPIICCSAKTGIGVKEVIESLIMCGLSPADITRRAADESEIAQDASAPLVARCFRTRIDPYVQKLSFLRIFSGTLKRDDAVQATGARKAIKMGSLLKVQGENTEQVDSAGPGDIVAVAKMDEIYTGSVLGETELPELKFPTPMVSLAVAPKSRGDETKLSGALNKVVEEDPTFLLDRDVQTKELVMTGMSELHLNVIQERLIRRDKLEVETREPRIAFRETIQSDAEGSYRHKKQSGGRGQFGEVHIRMRPLPRGTDISEFATKSNFNSMRDSHYDEKANFLWVDSIVGGTIPTNFMPAVGKGFVERIEGGVIAGYPVQDVCVEVHFGKYHDVDSSEAAFKTAAKHAFKQVFEKARPCLLEPVVNLDVTVPEDNVGDVYSDMSSRGGRIQGSDAAGGGFTTIHSECPLREVTTYSRTLSSMTGGLGSYTMEFSHYDVMPANVQQDVISKNKMSDDEDE